MRRILFVMILILFSSISFADEYVLVMSKDDKVCQHMLNIYNEDLRKYGEIKYAEHEEFKAIKWEKRKYLFEGKKRDKPLLISKFDINNDGKPEVIIKDENRNLKGIPSDALYVFREEDFDYSKTEVAINEDFANKAIGAWGGVFYKKPFEGNVYRLYELPVFEIWTIPEIKEKIRIHYSLGGWFYFHTFIYKGKYFTSMYDLIPEDLIENKDLSEVLKKWEVILQYTPENQLKDICYLLKVCECHNKSKGGK